MKRIVISLLLLTVISLGGSTIAAGPSTSMNIAPESGSYEAITSQTYTTRDLIEIYNNGEMEAMAITEGWDGDGSAEHPYVITGYRLTATHTQPIRIWNVDLHWEFVDNIIEWGAVCGTYFAGCENGLIANNTFHGRHSGMVVQNCENLIIRNNIVDNNTANGIEIFQGSVNLTIESNKISDSAEAGIYVPFSNDFIIADNEISNSGTSGIAVVGLIDSLITENIVTGSTEHGIYLYSLQDSRVTHNTVEDSGIYGVYMSLGAQNIFSKNWIENSTSFGASLGIQCTNATFWGNVLIDNGVDCQACDNGTDNVFAYTYFDDWTSPDDNSDGYVDLPYVIAGTAANEDPYPRTGIGVDVPCRLATTTTSATTSSTTTTTTTTTTTDLPMVPILELSVAVGAVAAIVLIVILVKRRSA